MNILRIVLVVTLSGCAFAQEPPTDTTAAPSSDTSYTGPSILSRGLGMAGPKSDAVANIRPFLSVEGIYDTNLTNISTDTQGNIPQQNSAGVQAGFGAYGYHSWKHSLLSLTYSGDYRHYTNNTYYDGTDQALSLGFTQQISRHWNYSVRPMAGTYSRGYSLQQPYVFTDPLYANVPSQDLFDNRTTYLSVLGDLVYEPTRRLSFDFGGDGFLQRRRSSSLAGMTGYRARANMAYRLSRRQTLGVDYSFDHWEYTHSFGTYDIHGLNLNYSAQLTKRWVFQLLGGAYRMESEALTTVELDPIVAQILGRTTGVAASYSLRYVPSIQGRLTWQGRRTTVGVNYIKGITPGNGVYLASRTDSGGVNVNYAATRNFSFGFDSGYTQYHDLTRSSEVYKGYNGGASMSYRVGKALFATFRTSYQRADTGSSTYNRDWLHVSLGFSYSPGDLPLVIW